MQPLITLRNVNHFYGDGPLRDSRKTDKFHVLS
jgi:hypothetical protein